MVIDMIVLNIKMIIFVSWVCSDYQLIYKNILLYYITSDSILKIDKGCYQSQYGWIYFEIAKTKNEIEKKNRYILLYSKANLYQVKEN